MKVGIFVLLLLTRLNPLHLFAPVQSQEPNIQWLSFVYVFNKTLVFLVFFYRFINLDKWFSSLNNVEWLYTSYFLALYSLLFSVSQGSVLKTVLWPIMVYFYKLWLGWRGISLALIPHLLISIAIC